MECFEMDLESWSLPLNRMPLIDDYVVIVDAFSSD